VVKRLEPNTPRRRPTRGYAAGGTDFILARLLLCPTCGTLLTGTRDRIDGPNKSRVRYSCRLGTATPHARISVSEHLILAAIRAEADRLVTPDQVESVQDDAGKRAELEARRLRIIDLYESGLIDRADRARRLAAVTDALERLDSRRIIEAVPTIDWSWPPRELNAVLRALFERVDLDPATFQPIGFAWAVPEWRAT
jgi:hypothetical protein